MSFCRKNWAPYLECNFICAPQNQSNIWIFNMNMLHSICDMFRHSTRNFHCSISCMCTQMLLGCRRLWRLNGVCDVLHGAHSLAETKHDDDTVWRRQSKVYASVHRVENGKVGFDINKHVLKDYAPSPALRWYWISVWDIAKKWGVTVDFNIFFLDS